MKARFKSGDCPEYINPEKWYDVERLDGYSSGFGQGFWVTFDGRSDADFCLEHSCCHLNGGEWELTEHEPTR